MSSNRTQKFKALSDETRLKILQILKREPQNVSALARQLQIRQNLLSHHLKILRDAALVQFETQGTVHLYQLSSAVKANGSTFTMDCCSLNLFEEN